MAELFEYRLEDKLIWDFSPLEEFLKKGFKYADLNKIAPKYIDKDFIEYCYVIFNVKSVINTNADSNDITNGFVKFKTDFHEIFEYLNEIILVRFIEEYNTNKSNSIKNAISREPVVTILLKFSYWYYKCSTLWDQSGFTNYSKKSEVRDRITEKFLRAFNEYHHSLNYEEDFKDETEQKAEKEYYKNECERLEAKMQDMLTKYSSGTSTSPAPIIKEK